MRQHVLTEPLVLRVVVPFLLPSCALSTPTTSNTTTTATTITTAINTTTITTAFSGEEPRLHAPPGPNASDEEVLNAMRARDSEFRRTEAVVEWLQDAAGARLGGALAQGLPGNDSRGGSPLGWSNTLESLAVGGGQKSEVAQMHPDANLRGLRGGGQEAGLKVMRLVGQDDLDEEELLRTAWVLTRAGKLSRAKRLCESRGQPWRAAAMGGGGVVGTRKMEGEEKEELEDIRAGYGALYSPGQGVWQEMCWQLRSVELSLSRERATIQEGDAGL